MWHERCWCFLVKYLSFFNYLKPFKKNEFLIFILQACLAHFMCGFIIYKISVLFFSIEIANLIVFIYIFSFWPYMMIVHGGYQHLSNFLFLISIYFLLNQSVINDNFFYKFFYIWILFLSWNFCISFIEKTINYIFCSSFLFYLFKKYFLILKNM